jgi:hypothetical protein
MGVKGVDISEDIRELLPTEEPDSSGRFDYAAGRREGQGRGRGLDPKSSTCTAGSPDRPNILYLFLDKPDWEVYLHFTENGPTGTISERDFAPAISGMTVENEEERKP